VATIKDVAERAGVSRSTVSYVLSGKRPISQEVQARVYAAMQALEYTPSVLARNLRQGSSGALGMVYPLSDVRFEFVKAAASVIQGSYALSLLTDDYRGEALVQLFKEQRVDGLILMQIKEHDERVEALRASDYPFVLIGHPEEVTALSFVDFDFEAAAYMAIAHLVELGHKVMGYITFPRHKRELNLGYLTRLERGYRRAQAEFDVEIIVVEADSSTASCAAATALLLDKVPNLSAIVALDVTAGMATHLAVFHALNRLGKRVPEDLSVICFNTRGVAEWSVPELTSIELPFDQMGKIGAELLLERLHGEREDKQLILPARLDVRSSTGRP
jgi:DNA-binding LacI/PurR family transcriptional regulator